MFGCNECSKSFDKLKFLMKHTRNAHAHLPELNCFLCNKTYANGDSFQKHMSSRHFNGNTYGPFLPAPNQNNEYIFPVNNFNAIPDAEYDYFEEPEERPEATFEHPEATYEEPNTAFEELSSQYLESCFVQWLQLVNNPNCTIKAASLFCEALINSSTSSIMLTQPFLEPIVPLQLVNLLKMKLIPFSSEHRRRKYLEEMGIYCRPEEYLTGIQHIVTGTPDGEALRVCRNLVAVIPIAKTLQSILSMEHIANSMSMPSHFANSPIIDHPFAGNRVRSLYRALNEDFLLIELYMDEFGTTCPLGNSSAVYKMAGWYFRLLNLPLDILSQLNHVLLAALAHAVDVMTDLQEIMKIILLPQLRDLEREGITFMYRGEQRTFKVILFCLVADNLGLHQLVGLTKCFSKNNPCWMCTETAQTLQRLHTLNLEKLRTRMVYDNLIQNGSNPEKLAYGISFPCCLNDLRYFHCMENFSVDYMHDLHEGHLKWLIPLVIRDAISSGVSLLSLNNAIAGFSFIGEDASNPIRPIYMPATENDCLQGDTAHNMVVLVKLLPLILKTSQIRLQTRSWQLFMRLQRILDLLYAPKSNDATIDMFDRLVKEYLREYINIGGKMTVKPHKLLHYKQVWKEMGPLRHLATFIFEAKHHHFKQYAQVNRCFKSLQYTLADKHELAFAQILQKMKSPTYLPDLRKLRNLNKLKRSLVVVYSQNLLTREPMFGEIQNFDVNSDLLTLSLLDVIEFDDVSYCYVVVSSPNTLTVNVDTLLCPEPLPLYRKRSNYIRMPYALL